MSLPDSPFGMHQAHPPKVQHKVVGGGQPPSGKFLKRATGNNINTGVALPQGSGFIRTQLYYAGGKTVAIHTYLHDKKLKSLTVGVQTQRHGHITPIKIDPQRSYGS